MVSIQNPSVTVSDVWNYNKRDITNVDDIALKSTNTLLNAILGNNFDQDSVGYYLTKGIAQDVIDATKNVNTVNYMFIKPMTGKRALRNVVQSVCTGYYDLTSPSPNAGIYTQGENILDGVTITEGTYRRFFGIIPKTIGTCVADMATPVQFHFTSPEHDTSSSSVYQLPKIDFDTDNFACTRVAENTTQWNRAAILPTARGVVNYVGTTGSKTPGTLTIPVTCLSNGDEVQLSPFTMTLQNIQNSDISGIYLSLPDINYYDITIELLINDTVTDTFTLTGDKDYFGTPSGWSHKGILNTDTVAVRLTCANAEKCFIVPIKSLIVSTALTPSG